eukprot:3423736-Amphidinium_carterae.1
MVAEPSFDGEVVVTLEAARTKVSRGIRRLRVPIPYVALAGGVSGYKWARAWWEMRKSFSCALDPSLGGISSA